MNEKEQILEAMRKAGEPLNAGIAAGLACILASAVILR